MSEILLQPYSPDVDERAVLEAYIQDVRRTWGPLPTYDDYTTLNDDRRRLAFTGVLAEHGELAHLFLRAYYQGTEVSETHILEELGDMVFFGVASGLCAGYVTGYSFRTIHYFLEARLQGNNNWDREPYITFERMFWHEQDRHRLVFQLLQLNVAKRRERYPLDGSAPAPKRDARDTALDILASEVSDLKIQLQYERKRSERIAQQAGEWKGLYRRLADGMISLLTT